MADDDGNNDGGPSKGVLWDYVVGGIIWFLIWFAIGWAFLDDLDKAVP